ncbi:RNA polymerase sigma factor [Clostridium grantii]|uniref:RNA polymerase sigma-70 factor, ECF subfamily n=1 Tax=Clostridium grantii DSM 8605 TaxID=1121316 RepID=A0A1M5TT12_9CLOT|nr:sigma-70 family RNA polymerase sigma factor [Clostridium grantii]SHH53917.1 RNA polymerase sigma-70 factor, ECF subfamily [Clostridium grantii DSM 8605]
MLEDDIKLIDKILEGDTTSFEKIVDKYEMGIMRYIYTMVKNVATAEDICQEVFIQVYNKLDTYNKNYKFSNWLIQIAKNKTIDYIRKENRTKVFNIDEAYNVSSKEISPEDSAEFNETKEYLKKYIEGLEEIEKQIIILRYSTKKTFKDIGTILDISESTVKKKFYKTRQEYKEYVCKLERRCEYGL